MPFMRKQFYDDQFPKRLVPAGDSGGRYAAIYKRLGKLDMFPTTSRVEIAD